MDTQHSRSHRRRGGRRLALVALLVVGVLFAPMRADADDKAKPKPKPAPAKAPAKPQPKPAPKPQPKPEEQPKKPLLEFVNEQVIEQDDGTVVYFYRTNFIKPDALAKNLALMGIAPGKQGFPGLVSLKVVPEQNQLLIHGFMDSVQIILDAIAYFDVAAPQVFIEVKVVEITYDSNYEFGLDYVADRTNSGPNTLFRGAGGILNPPSFLRSDFPPGIPFQGSSLVFGLVGKNAEKYGEFDVTLQALLQNGKAEILSEPSIIATQGLAASVETTEQIPIMQLNSADRNNERFSQSTIKTGVTMKVTPNHVGNQFVTLKIDPQVLGTQGLASDRVGGTFAPISTSRKVSTTVTLRDKETLVIGGLYTNRRVKAKAKTPIFSDMPLIGELFTRTREEKQKTELVFILTPHIVRKTGDLKIVVPPSELQRLENTPEKGKKPCRPGWPPFLTPPGAHFMDDDE